VFLAAENVTPPVAVFAIKGQRGRAAAAREKRVAVMVISKAVVKPMTPAGKESAHSPGSLP